MQTKTLCILWMGDSVILSSVYDDCGARLLLVAPSYGIWVYRQFLFATTKNAKKDTIGAYKENGIIHRHLSGIRRVHCHHALRGASKST